jgi:outer membrane protein assembly factor BamB
MPRFFVSVVVIVILATGNLAADNWPQWRGPSATGVATPGDYPVAFGTDNTLAWKVAMPSPSSSTPAVWGDRIFVTSAIGRKDGVLCYDFNGKEQWRTTFGREVTRKHATASGSNSSPVTDGKRVFVYFKSGTIAALDLKGKLIWKANLQKRYGKNTLRWDLGTSPVLAAGNLVVAVIQAGNSFVVALDATTGKEVWKEARHFTCPPEADQSYTTPSVVTIGGRKRIIIWGADALTAHDAATGRTLWICEGFNPKQKGMWRTIASASVYNNVAIISYGRGKNLCAIDLRDGLDSNKRWLWNRDDVGSDVPTPITFDGKAYILEDGGKLVCVDILTGKDLWVSKAPRGNGRYYASPIMGGGNIYCVSEKGTLVVVHPENHFPTATTNTLNESVISTPVLINDRLLIRGAKHLFCFTD